MTISNRMWIERVNAKFQRYTVDNELCALEKKKGEEEEKRTKSRYTRGIDDYFSSFGDSMT